MKVSETLLCILINNTFINIKKSKVLFQTRMNHSVFSGLHFYQKSAYDLNQCTQTGVAKMRVLPLQYDGGDDLSQTKVCTISFERPVNYLCDAWHVFPPSTKRGLILIGLELNTYARESFEHC